jgi:hypothetical protein
LEWFREPEVFIGPYPSGLQHFCDVSSFGGKVGFFGTVGNDDFGKLFKIVRFEELI